MVYEASSLDKIIDRLKANAKEGGGYIDTLALYKYNTPYNKANGYNDRVPIFMGFEWETSISTSSLKALFEFVSNDKRVYQSVNLRPGGSPLEMVSSPMCLRDHKDLIEHINKNVDLDKMCRPNIDCGVHVHIDKEAFKRSLHLHKFITFISLQDKKHLEELGEIAGRPQGPEATWRRSNQHIPVYHSYGKFKGKLKRVVLKLAAKRQRRLTPDEVKRAGTVINAQLAYHDGKGVAVNTQSGKPTIELRIFASPKDSSNMMRNLEFVDALVRFTERARFHELTWEDLYAYVLNYPETDRYPLLKAFIDSKQDRLVKQA